MPINTRELLEAVAILTDEQNIRVTLKHSGRGALMGATGCFVGGMLAGPIGIAIGGSLAACSAAYMSKGQFKPVAEIIRNDLSERHREMLAEHVRIAVSDIQITDLSLLLPLIMGNVAIQRAVLNTVISFITNEMRMQIVD